MARHSTRRQFLRGTGGVVLGLPLLPSLLPRGAEASVTSAPPRLVMMLRTHGAVHDKNDVADALLTNRMTMHPGHEMRWGPVPSSVQGSRTVVSRVVQADSSVLDDRMLQRLNVIRGLDCPQALSDHNSWGFGAVGQSKVRREDGVPSIDQFAAWSPSYSAVTNNPVRSIIAGSGSFSFQFANPTEGTGRLNAQPVESDPGRLFESLFLLDGAGEPTPEVSPRTPLVDHVIDDYRMIRNSNRRLSSEDRHRLDAHLEMMLDLQRRIAAAGNIAQNCAQPEAPGSFSPNSASDYIELYQTYNDLIAAAFKCGVTRIATVSPEMMGYDWFRDPREEWHGMHHGGYKGPDDAEPIAEARQIFFEHIFLDLARKLDVEEADGRTFLDNTFMLFTSDQGARTHNLTDIFMVTLGDACGHFHTGRYVDYRNREKFVRQGYIREDTNPLYAGITMQQFWANLLDGLRIPRSEWARHADGGGYGTQTIHSQPLDDREDVKGDPAHYVSGVRERSGEALPAITV